MGNLDSGRKPDPDHRRAVEECRGRLTVRAWRSGTVPPDAPEMVELVTTRPRFGGRRSWFACPGCGRRCGVLYQPTEGDPWRCRRCHALTYLSARHAHREELAWVGIASMIGRLEATDGDWERVLSEASPSEILAWARMAVEGENLELRDEWKDLERRARERSRSDRRPR